MKPGLNEYMIGEEYGWQRVIDRSGGEHWWLLHANIPICHSSSLLHTTVLYKDTLYHNLNCTVCAVFVIALCAMCCQFCSSLSEQGWQWMKSFPCNLCDLIFLQSAKCYSEDTQGWEAFVIVLCAVLYSVHHHQGVGNKWSPFHATCAIWYFWRHIYYCALCSVHHHQRVGSRRVASYKWSRRLLFQTPPLVIVRIMSLLHSHCTCLLYTSDAADE